MISFLSFNPEIWRYCRQDFTPIKLFLVPALCVMLAVVQFVVGFSESYLGTIYKFGILLVLFIFGTRVVADGLASEIEHQRWSLVSLTSMHPFTVWLGRLLGPTCFYWYCAVVFAFGYILYGEAQEPSGLKVLIDHAGNIETVFQYFVVAVLTHIWALALSLIYVTTKGSHPRAIRMFTFPIASLLGYAFLRYNLQSAQGGDIFNLYGIGMSPTMLYWAGILFFAFWGALIGIRLIKVQFQYVTYPVCFIAFMVSFAILLQGIQGVDMLLAQIPNATLLPIDFMNRVFHIIQNTVLGGVFLLLAYCAMILDDRGLIKVTHFMSGIETKQWQKAFRYMPWGIFFFVGAVLCVSLAALPILSGQLRPLELLLPSVGVQVSFSGFGHFLLLGVLYFLRDSLMMHSLSLAVPQKMRALASLCYWITAYFILPMIAYMIDDKIGYELVLPTTAQHVLWLSYGVVLVQIVGAGFWLTMSFRRKRQALDLLRDS